ncbi:hypothetical protein FD31_GL000999 [Companilactobacillus nantensis DSM 16982]|uniref:Uncharacterized protein n=2 Tax=Companilactobacillus nantensis TaxID=305793 RepID=A0A0R1WQJ6_9LACO|nr:hypothetical protein FD31_GL000999 [Companilactobacillus nantensis DSM 16982]
MPDVTTKWFGQEFVYLDIYINEHPSKRAQILKDIDDFIHFRADFKEVKKIYCAECGIEIEDDYYTVGDDFLKTRYFEEQDGSDNIFCSEECLLTSLSVMSYEVEK